MGPERLQYVVLSSPHLHAVEEKAERLECNFTYSTGVLMIEGPI